MSNKIDTYRNLNKNTSKRVAWIVTGVSSAFCLLVILLLFLLGKEEIKPKAHILSKDVIDLLDSPQINYNDSVNMNSSDIGIALPRGGWVQQTDSLGNLVQQYRCEELDPNPVGLPDGWIEMKKPEIELYLGDNKLIRITGNSGIVNAPKRLLESGEISGNVQVRLFELDAISNAINPIPSMELQTLKINFDNFIGEISCPSEVRVTSPSHTLVGRQLTIRFNDLEERIEYLRLAELDYIEFNPSESASSPISSSVLPEVNPQIKQLPSRQNNRRVHAAESGNEFEYYIVTFIDNVRILQGNQVNGRSASGDTLTISFSNKSNPNQTTQKTSFQGPSKMLSPSIVLPLSVALVSTTLGQSQPTESASPVRITCEGGLTMIPLEDPALLPSSPTETRIDIYAYDDSPAQIIDYADGMSAFGSVIRYELEQDRTDLFGDPAELIINEMKTSSNHLWVARNDGIGGADGSGKMEPTTQQQYRTTLVWSEGVDFYFEPTESESKGALNEVICHGDVVLTDKGSSVECDTLNVTFVTEQDGSSAPSLAVATGGIKAISESQTMWADRAEVSFSSEQNTEEIDDESMFGGSHADRMVAVGDVQIVLEDGGRAFCDSLDGKISQDSATLRGNVVIAYQQMLMNKGETATLTLDRSTGKGTWSGSGQALFLNEPIDVSPNRRIDRPKANFLESTNHNIHVSMRANWEDSMLIDQEFHDGAGALDLNVHVSIRSQRTPEERSSMTGEYLRLEFSNTSGSNDNKELNKVIAKDQAQIEHRTLDIHSHELPPIVYYIGGDHLEFEVASKEMLAVGNGELVLRDPRQPVQQLHQSALAGRGTTRFTWDEKLKTTSIDDDVYRLEMTGNVEMVHKGLDGTIGVLTSDRIEAIAIDPNTVETTPTGGSQITLRGMDLQQLIATGSVYVATESRRVDCDKFDYNLKTGFAKLSAKKSKSVAIVTEGTPYPVRASSIIWNMDPAIDTIRIRGLQGTTNN